ncbi:MAG TPA: hypothetical protein VNE67_15740 [Acetobacteraceae bacterium]|nr:hypothetical protein [Acetobacteraceae bacterium]
MDGWSELARARTNAGDLLVLRERAGCVELRCNGWELMSNRAHHSETALAVLACAWIAQAEWGRGEGEQHVLSARAECGIAASAGPCVLIGGLGFGYTVRAALDHLPGAARVVVAEMVPEIIAWNRGPLAPLAGHPLADPRASVACTDIAALLRSAAPASFDAILLDTDNGPDAVMLAGNAALYGPENLRLIRRALRPAGVLAVWSADRSPRFAHALHGAGFQWEAHDVPARGGADDPRHTIYLARDAA